MSSHHFVKEGQEPALLIAEVISLELTEPLLEWVPLVIVLGPALEDVLRWGVKVDVVVVGHEPEVLMKEKLSEQNPVSIVTCEQSEELIVAAMNFLTKAKQPAVTIVVNPTTQLFNVLSSFHSSGMNIRIVNQDKVWSVCATRFEKWFPAAQKIQIQKNSPHQQFQLNGLVATDSHYMTANAGFIRVQSDLPFWIGEDH